MRYKIKGSGEYTRWIVDHHGAKHAAIVRLANGNWRLSTLQETPFPGCCKDGCAYPGLAAHEFRSLINK